MTAALPYELLPNDMIIAEPPEWTRDGLCLEYPHVEFFPERGQDSTPAKAVCAGCAVKRECLAYALDGAEREGIWGGSSGRDRRTLRKRGVTGDLIRRHGARVDEAHAEWSAAPFKAAFARWLPGRGDLTDDGVAADA
jgi:WhiB family redox-sensing transcriptional regulator